MAFFVGTDTGNKYTVGQSYTMAGDVYRANADGTFTNQRTQRATVGSSEKLRQAAASVGQSLASGGGGGVRTPPIASGLNVDKAGNVTVTDGGFTVDGKSVGSGPGVGRAASAVTVGGVSKSTAARVGAILANPANDWGWLNVMPVDTSERPIIAINGFGMPINPRTSMAQSIEDMYGEADFWNPIAGLAQTAANLSHIGQGIGDEFGRIMKPGYIKVQPGGLGDNIGKWAAGVFVTPPPASNNPYDRMKQEANGPTYPKVMAY